MQLRPEDETSDNEFAAILRYGGLSAAETRRVRIETTGIPPLNLEDFAAIIVGGSPFDISTPEPAKTPMQRRIERDFNALFKGVVARDFPFLGACSGNGLLGCYCGAVISRRFAEPVGGVDVTLTEAGRADPLLTGFPPMFRALVGHKEACDACPPGAAWLASSPTCPIQMFRVGRNAYATQFHPEADPDVFVMRIQTYKDYGYFPPKEAERLIAAVRDEEAPYPNVFLRRFVERYRE